jgi:hypothetical protein
MTTAYKPIKAKAFGPFTIALVNSTTPTALVSAPTITAANFKVSTDGGAFANIATTPTVTPTGGPAVKLSFTNTETAGDSVVLWINGITGAADQLIEFLTQDLSFAAFHYAMRDTSGNPKTGLGSAVTAVRVIDTGTFAAGTLGATTEIGNGLYRVVWPAADVNATDCVSLYATATGCMPTLITLTNK